ncbi:MAG TPA: PQQ-binding-like beta-propeller repeat protein [Usitatibacter sp.]|jgi:hypothetical protein|nr:PQQ-binding-like beta-propeller repeat protein [Usitatibacter sp.]
MRLSARIAAVGALVALAAAFGSHAQSQLWSRSYNGPSGVAAAVGDGYVVTRSLAADASGNILTAGVATGGAGPEFLTTKIDGATGAIAWQKVFNSPAGKGDSAIALAADSGGNAIVAGWSYDASGNPFITVVKYAAADGTVAWQRTLTGGTYDVPLVVATDAAGNAIVGGETNASGTSDLRITKLAAATGAVLWDKSFDGGRDDFMSDLAVDGSGNAVVLGTSVNAAGNDDFTIAKYAASTGALLWKQSWDGGADDKAYGVALDSGGNAFVTGSTHAATDDLVVLKLATADGTIAWMKTWDGGGADAGQAIAVDAAGNAIVTGQSQNAAGNRDFVTLKLGASDGKVLWQRTFDGGGNDYAYDVALDASGNAVVVGSASGAGATDWKVIAYAPADGATVYQAGYAGSAGQADEAYEAVATRDGVVIAGTVNETGLATQVRLAKIATGIAATGSSASNVALASNGGVATASSTNAAYTVAAVNNGDRTGANITSNIWVDDTRDVFPDWVRIDFSGAKTIDHVVVYSVQDNYTSPIEPTDTLTFTSFGLTAFDVQGWNGSAWVTLGSVTGNNLVKRTVTFPAATVSAIRVNVSSALLHYSRIVEIEAWTASSAAGAASSTNFALASNGGTASASSTNAAYTLAALNNGDRRGANLTANVWVDDTRDVFPDWVEIDFPAAHAIDHVVVYSVQDNYLSPVEPTDTMTFTSFGVTAFDVQGWNGSAWVTLGSVAGNNLVKRTVSFPAVSVSRVRVNVKSGLLHYSRIVEVEAWGAS